MIVITTLTTDHDYDYDYDYIIMITSLTLFLSNKPFSCPFPTLIYGL